MDALRLQHIQGGLTLVALPLIWLLETWMPLLKDRPHRYRHAARNFAIGGINLLVIGWLFAGVMAAAATWAQGAHFGLLRLAPAPAWLEVGLAILLLDAWMYLWHRANHAVPLLWRFHRMHHSDPAMDVTTALRFHFGEIVFSSALRLAVIPLLGLELWHVLLYETLLLPVIAFHHSNVALPERWDRLMRLAVVSPNMHRVHHSDWQPETDSNFSSIFSWWDRLLGTFRRRDDVRTLRYGLRELDAETWQTVRGLITTPLARTARVGRAAPDCPLPARPHPSPDRDAWPP